jgi:hypothetical protein
MCGGQSEHDAAPAAPDDIDAGEALGADDARPEPS